MSMIDRICSRLSAMEDDDLVDPVEELRTEVRAQRVHDLPARPFVQFAAG